MIDPTAARDASTGDVICLSDDDAQAATTRPTADPHSGDNYGQQRAVDISNLLIRPILSQESRAKRYLDALDRSIHKPPQIPALLQSATCPAVPRLHHELRDVPGAGPIVAPMSTHPELPCILCLCYVGAWLVLHARLPCRSEGLCRWFLSDFPVKTVAHGCGQVARPAGARRAFRERPRGADAARGVRGRRAHLREVPAHPGAYRLCCCPGQPDQAGAAPDAPVPLHSTLAVTMCIHKPALSSVSCRAILDCQKG